MPETTDNTGNVSPFIAPDAPMLSDVLLMLEDHEALGPSRLRDLKSALRTIARLIGKPLEAIPANINWLHIRLRRVHPAAHNMSRKRFANVKSDALKALAITGCSRARADWLREPSPGWAGLLDRLPGKHDRWRLSQLAQYCSALGIEPHEVTDQHLLGLHQAMTEETFQDRPEHVVANAIKVWNRMREQIEGWPDTTLSPLPRKKPRWTFPIESFPESFQADVAAWIDHLQNPDFLNATGPAKPLRPTTIAHRRFQIQEAASALVLSGRLKEEITDLAVLVDLENLKAELRWMMARFDGKPTGAIKGLAVGLQAVAKHHVGVDEDHLKDVKSIVKRLGRETDGLREKNRQRLLQLEDPHNMAKLLHLPEALVREANKLKTQKPRKAVLMLQAALAIEILLNTPMRVGNLASLNLERHLRPLGRGRKRMTHVHIPPTEVKNEKALDYEWGPDLTALLELYLAEARPVLMKKPSEFLFPAMDGGHKGSTHLSRLIKDTILEHTGLEINAHLFRSIAGKIHSQVQPGDMATLSYLLNDSLKTVMKYYAQFERRAALEHYQDSLSKVRKSGGGRS